MAPEGHNQLKCLDAKGHDRSDKPGGDLCRIANKWNRILQTNGTELGKSTIISGSYSEVDGAHHAGICIYYGYGVGWVSALDGLAVRTHHNGVLYYSGDAGVSWNMRPGPFEARAVWASDLTPSNVAVAKRGSANAADEYHVIKATSSTGKTWISKAGANADQAITGGGDSVPYDCGGASENGLYFFIPE